MIKAVLKQPSQLKLLLESASKVLGCDQTDNWSHALRAGMGCPQAIITLFSAIAERPLPAITEKPNVTHLAIGSAITRLTDGDWYGEKVVAFNTYS
ncbi:MAG: hypothetical protein JOZ78_08385 [Chroococcidiopsidaceae cyanobacterium CP_BM_ER_R8_30]|nr:hypothetical protein [Chroococcidiopsidaceae cyanobacterium CP_BM_ER_R8_30]